MRYWAEEVLCIIRRAGAVATWSRIADGEENDGSLIEGMAAFVAYKGSYPSSVRSLLPPFPLRSRR